MFNLLKKKPEKQIEDEKKPQCTGDPSCPMCHIGDDTLKTLEKEADKNEQDPSTHSTSSGQASSGQGGNES